MIIDFFLLFLISFPTSLMSGQCFLLRKRKREPTASGALTKEHCRFLLSNKPPPPPKNFSLMSLHKRWSANSGVLFVLMTVCAVHWLCGQLPPIQSSPEVHLPCTAFLSHCCFESPSQQKNSYSSRHTVHIIKVSLCDDHFDVLRRRPSLSAVCTRIRFIAAAVQCSELLSHLTVRAVDFDCASLCVYFFLKFFCLSC